jgi:hypothetical protein
MKIQRRLDYIHHERSFSMTSLSTIARITIAYGLATAMASPAAAQFSNNYQVSIPVLPGPLIPNQPGFNGEIELDPDEWRGSIIYRMEDGASRPAAYMKAMADATNIWLGFSAQDHTSCTSSTTCWRDTKPLFSTDDIIVVAYNTNGSWDGYRRLHIQPCVVAGTNILNTCSVSGAAANSQSARLTYWEGRMTGGIVNWQQIGVSVAGPLPNGIEARTASSNLGPNGTWSVELKLPRIAVPVLDGSSFGLFVDVIPTDSNGSKATQYTWPSDLQIGYKDSNDIRNKLEETPPPRTWGIARLGGPAAGVNIVGFGSDYYTDPTKVLTNKPNEFHATLVNGGSATASSLVATFSVNNFGANAGTWNQFTTTSSMPLARGNPTPPFALDQNEYRTVYSGAWAATGSTYAPPNDFRCFKVEVAAGLNGPVIQRYFNMQFVTVDSPFTVTPTITLPKRSDLTDRKTKPKITLREEFINVEPEMRWKTEFGGAKQLDDGSWLVQPKTQGATKLKASVLVDDSLKLPVRDFALKPENAAGLKIDVEPGSTITLLADGAFKSRFGTVTPAGLNDSKRITPRQVKLLDTTPSKSGRLVSFIDDMQSDLRERNSKNPIRPWALIGSFDGFRSSFLIGPAATVAVPERSDVLAVRLAPVEGLSLPADGDGYVINVIGQATRQLATIPEVDLSLFRNSGLTLLPLGSNLPAWVVRAELDTGLFVTINGNTYQSRLPIGSFGSFITRVR